MTPVSVRDWLPDTAFLGQDTISPLVEAVLRWGKQWLATGELVQNGGCHMIPTPLPEARLQVSDGCAVLCSAESRLDLASLLLSCEVNTRRLRAPCDQAVIGQLVDEALVSLVAALREIPVAARTYADAPCYSIDIGIDPAKPIFAIVCSRSHLIALAQAQAPPRRAGLPAQPLATAIQDQTVSMGARLGHCQLSLAEVEALDVGDIIVLDQVGSNPVDLLIGNGHATQGGARVSTTARNLTLILERNTDQW